MFTSKRAHAVECNSDGALGQARIVLPACRESKKGRQMVESVDTQPEAKRGPMRFQNRDRTHCTGQRLQATEEPFTGRCRQFPFHDQVNDGGPGRQHIVEVGRATLVPPQQSLDDPRAIPTMAGSGVGREQGIDGNGIAPVPTMEFPIGQPVGGATESIEMLVIFRHQPASVAAVATAGVARQPSRPESNQNFCPNLMPKFIGLIKKLR